MTNGVATAEGRGFGDNTMLIAAVGVLAVGAIGFTIYNRMKNEGGIGASSLTSAGIPASQATPKVAGQTGSTQITTTSDGSAIVSNGGTQVVIPGASTASGPAQGGFVTQSYKPATVMPGQAVGTTVPVQYPWSTMTTYQIPVTQTYTAATKTYAPYNTPIPVTVTEPGVTAGIPSTTVTYGVGTLVPLNRYQGDTDVGTQCPGGNLQGGSVSSMQTLLYGTDAASVAWRARFCS